MLSKLEEDQTLTLSHVSHLQIINNLFCLQVHAMDASMDHSIHYVLLCSHWIGRPKMDDPNEEGPYFN